MQATGTMPASLGMTAGLAEGWETTMFGSNACWAESVRPSALQALANKFLGWPPDTTGGEQGVQVQAGGHQRHRHRGPQHGVAQHGIQRAEGAAPGLDPEVLGLQCEAGVVLPIADYIPSAIGRPFVVAVVRGSR